MFKVTEPSPLRAHRRACAGVNARTQTCRIRCKVGSPPSGPQFLSFQTGVRQAENSALCAPAAERLASDCERFAASDLALESW